MENACSIILAAGAGTRMFTKKPKVLLKVLFKPMLKWVVDSVFRSEIYDTCIVCGYEHKKVEKYLKDNNIEARIVIQNERKGTAHAVYVAKDYLEQNIEKDVIILAGDGPFIDVATIKSSYYLHKKNDNDATVITAKIENPFGYGRIVRDPNTKSIIAIVEQKDATDEVKTIKEVNSGTYWFKVKSLLEVLPQINNYNNQSEFYLPDTIKLLLNNARRVGTFFVKDQNIILGANTKEQLNKLNEIAINKRLCELMNQGVDIPLKEGIIISEESTFGEDVKILPGTVICGKSKIGSNCTIGPGVYIENCTIKDNTSINCMNLKNKVLD